MQYSTAEAADLLGLSPQQVRRCVAAGVIEPARGARGAFRFTSRDLFLVRAAFALRNRENTSGQLKIDFDVVRLAASVDAIPRVPFALDSEIADAHVDFGCLLHEQGRIGEAATHYLQALRYHPENAVAAFNLGIAMEDLGRVTEAVKSYEQCIASDPAFADAHYNLATLLEKTGDKRGAIRHLTKYKKLAGTTSHK
jgi:tetratricopeptide (TPR) repeat protein